MWRLAIIGLIVVAAGTGLAWTLVVQAQAETLVWPAAPGPGGEAYWQVAGEAMRQAQLVSSLLLAGLGLWFVLAGLFAWWTWERSNPSATPGRTAIHLVLRGVVLGCLFLLLLAGGENVFWLLLAGLVAWWTWQARNIRPVSWGLLFPVGGCALLLGSFFALWWWPVRAYFHHFGAIESMGIPSPLRERALIGMLQMHLPFLAASWVLVLLAAGVLAYCWAGPQRREPSYRFSPWMPPL